MVSNNRYPQGGGNVTGKGFDEARLDGEYLKAGYYTTDEKGCKIIKRELLLEIPEEIVKKINSKNASPKLKGHQLRRFFDHCRGIERKLEANGGKFKCVEGDIEKLRVFALDAKGRNKIPQIFLDFININVGRIKDEKDFSCFMQHFEAILAYFNYTNPKER